MPTKTSSSARQNLKTLGRVVLALGCISLAFLLGIETTGEIHPLHQESQAAKPFQAQLLTPQAGDIDANGMVNDQDVILILEVAEKLRSPSREEVLHGDTDGDGKLTVKDALRILRSLSLQ